MERRILKGTDLEVSRACFGTMTFGGQTDQRTATKMIDRCLEAGINFFDTANVYQKGASEEMLGEALKGRREGVVVASKVRGKMGEGPDQVGLSHKAIVRAVEESLNRLQTDYLDIYYLHLPDYDVPIEETLDAIERLVRQGKIRYPASSNYSSWQACRMLWIAEEREYRPIHIAQQMYNLIARGVEQEFVPMAIDRQVSIIGYNPLAGGLLTGKHDMKAITPGTRFDNNKMYQDRYWHQEYFEAVELLKEAAQQAGRTLVSVALNWLLHHTVTDCVILGASRLDQLDENLTALDDGGLTTDLVGKCDAVWNTLRGPTPNYNR